MNILEKIIYKIKYTLAYYQVKQYLKNNNEKTSISDNGIYPAFCKLASENENIFSKFRRNPIYNLILEHVDQKQGEEYLHVIEMQSSETNKFTEENWKEFQKNDLYGAPKTFKFKINNKTYLLSPTTLRYVKVLQDILINFNCERIKSIAEIGIGYGGQARVIKTFLKDISITLYDLFETNLLAKKYLNNYTLSSISFIDADKPLNPDDITFDLVISNYAFSELTKQIQDKYIQEVILKSKAGYITYNELSYKMLDGYSVDEILKIIPNSQVIAEKPLTYKNNCIIIWGIKK